MTKTLPSLYSIDSKGKERVWKCKIIENVVYREHGLVSGKKVESKREFKGKSIGKKNETTPEEQAWAEANKEWVKHIDKDYHPAKDDKEGLKLYEKVKKAKLESGGHNINTGAAIGARESKKITRRKGDSCIVDTNEDVLIPMKAQVWELEDEKDPRSVKDKVLKYFYKTEGKGKNMTLKSSDFYCQPKLDGWRAIVRITDGKVLITSNSGKQYPWFKSLRDIFNQIDMNKINILDGLDGELYALELMDENKIPMPDDKRFSTICSICGLARTEPHELEDQIQFHVFDLVDKSGKFSQTERFRLLDNFFEAVPEKLKKRIIKVPIHTVCDVKDVSEYHDKYAGEGYEGVVLRSFNNFYKVGKRSNDMRKYKNFIDEEYQIVDCKLDDGVSNEHFVWRLKSGDTVFSAKPKGTREEKKEWYKNRNKYIGRWLTVKFQEYSEDGIPRFPIAKEFRTNKSED